MTYAHEENPCTYIKLLLFFSFLETGSCYIAHAGLELTILLPQSFLCWTYRHITPSPFINFQCDGNVRLAERKKHVYNL
jgi:hypothetical protein